MMRRDAVTRNKIFTIRHSPLTITRPGKPAHKAASLRVMVSGEWRMVN
ncbi:MAG: hypothetical protein U0Z53_32090 [Blastocatellia bacterium]